MLLPAVNHRTVRVQLDFRDLALFRIYGENDTGVQRMRKIFADSVDLLFHVQFQCRGWLGMPKSHRNFDVAHRLRSTSEVICVGMVAGVWRKGVCPSPRDISLRCAARYRWSRRIASKRYADRCRAGADLRWR